MENLEMLIKEHVDLLKSRGYDEQALKNGFLGQNIFDDLKRKLSDSIARAEEAGNPVAFILRTKGLFNDNKDLVEYRLYYRTDPEKSALDLKYLELAHEGFVKTFSLNTSYRLPSSKEAFELLLQDRERIQQRNERHFAKQGERLKLNVPKKKRGRRL